MRPSPLFGPNIMLLAICPFYPHYIWLIETPVLKVWLVHVVVIFPFDKQTRIHRFFNILGDSLAVTSP
jgi:hypothetical protein